MLFRSRAIAILLLLAFCAVGSARAEDKLKIAIGMHGNWEDAAAELGSRAGIFQKAGMQLELLYTHGAGEALQAVISGSVDIGVGVGTAGVMAAFLRGAPVRAIGSATTGTKDIYWYVRSSSPLRSLKEARPDTTIAYSTAGAATNFFVNGLLKTYNIEARPTATGDMQSTLTQVMTGQVDVGFAAPPLGLRQVEDGSIRIVARASDIVSTRDQTVPSDHRQREQTRKRTGADFQVHARVRRYSGLDVLKPGGSQRVRKVLGHARASYAAGYDGVLHKGYAGSVQDLGPSGADGRCNRVQVSQAASHVHTTIGALSDP
jgi:hypothetical protein